MKRRWILGSGILQYAIQLPGPDTSGILIINIIDHLENFGHPLARQR